MTVIEQTLNYISSLEDGEIKTNLNKYMGEIQSVDSEKTQAVKDARVEPKALKEQIKGIYAELGLEQNSTLENIKEYKSNMTNASKLQELEDSLKSKHESDLTELRTAIETKDKEIEGLGSKFDNLQFSTNVLDKGLLNDFTIDNKLVRDGLISQVRDKIIFTDEGAFLKDANGNVQTDTLTGKAMPVESFIESLKTDSTYKDFVKNPVQGNGSDVQGSRSNEQSTNNIDTSKHKSLDGFMGEAMKNIKQG